MYLALTKLRAAASCKPKELGNYYSEFLHQFFHEKQLITLVSPYLSIQSPPLPQASLNGQVALCQLPVQDWEVTVTPAPSLAPNLTSWVLLDSRGSFANYSRWANSLDSQH